MGVELNVKNEVIEENPLSLTNSINMDPRTLVDLQKKIKDKEEVVQSSNNKPNRVRSYWRPIPHAKFPTIEKKHSTLDERPTPAPNTFKINYRSQPRKDEKACTKIQ